jgi:60 kDa SS-A/Ro ribonucleoprotein
MRMLEQEQSPNVQPEQKGSSHHHHREQFKRFLWTGSEAGVYQASGDAAALDFGPSKNSGLVKTMQALGGEAVDVILSTPQARPEAAFFALAVAASPRFATREVNAGALAALPLVARKAHHITAFTDAAAKTRGWGRGLRSAVSNWYAAQPANLLVSQILRRPSRNLKTHRSLLRLAHPKANTAEQNALYQWISEGSLGHLGTPDIRSASLRQAEGFERARDASSAGELVQIIEDYRLGPAHVPLRWHGQRAVWEAMFDHLSYRQLLRHLPAMTASGLLTRQSEFGALAVARIADRGRIRAASVHPLRIAEAMKYYRGQGKGVVESVFDALDEALHLAAAETAASSVEAGSRILVAVDGTASMQGATVCGMAQVPAALAAGAMLLGFPVHPQLPAVVFHREVAREIEPVRNRRLPDILNQVRCTPSRSDASAPVEYAIRNRLKVDAFVILTDRQSSTVGLAQSLLRYREASGCADAKVVLVQMASRDVPGWQPAPGAIAFAGLDAHAPVSLHAFLRDNGN